MDATKLISTSIELANLFRPKQKKERKKEEAL
jgi:hypothetical protein